MIGTDGKKKSADEKFKEFLDSAEGKDFDFSLAPIIDPDLDSKLDPDYKYIPEELRDIIKFAAPPHKRLPTEENLEYNKKALEQRPVARKNPDGSKSSHLMATETFDGKTWYSFPTIFPVDPENPTENPEDWIEFSEKNREDAFLEAQRRGEVFEFGTDKNAAIKFGKGSWKKGSDPTKQLYTEHTPKNNSEVLSEIDNRLGELKDQIVQTVKESKENLNFSGLGSAKDNPFTSYSREVESHPDLAGLNAETESLLDDRYKISGEYNKLRKETLRQMSEANPSSDVNETILRHFMENGGVSSEIIDNLRDQGYDLRQVDNVVNDITQNLAVDSFSKLGQERQAKLILPYDPNKKLSTKELNTSVNLSSKLYSKDNFFDEDEVAMVDIVTKIDEIVKSKSSYDEETNNIKPEAQKKIDELNAEYIELYGKQGWLDIQTGFRKVDESASEENQEYSEDVNEEIQNIRAQFTTREKLEKELRDRYYAFLELNSMLNQIKLARYDVNDSRAKERFGKIPERKIKSEAPVSGRGTSNLEKMLYDANVNLEAISRLYHLNQTPGDVKYAEGGKTELFFSGLGETLVGEKVNAALFGSNPIKQSQALSEVLTKADVQLSENEVKALETTNTEQIIYGAGAVAGVVGQFAALDKVGAAMGIVNTLKYLRAAKSATPRFLGWLGHLVYEDLKFGAIGGEMGAGASFTTISGMLNKIPGVGGKFGRIGKIAKQLATADVSMTAASDIAHTVEVFRHNLGKSEDFKYQMEQYFGTSTDEVLNKYMIDLSTNWLFGVKSLLEMPRNERAMERARMKRFSKMLEINGDNFGKRIVDNQIAELEKTKSLKQHRLIREQTEKELIQRQKVKQFDLKNELTEKKRQFDDLVKQKKTEKRTEIEKKRKEEIEDLETRVSEDPFDLINRVDLTGKRVDLEVRNEKTGEVETVKNFSATRAHTHIRKRIKLLDQLKKCIG